MSTLFRLLVQWKYNRPVSIDQTSDRLGCGRPRHVLMHAVAFAHAASHPLIPQHVNPAVAKDLISAILSNQASLMGMERFAEPKASP